METTTQIAKSLENDVGMVSQNNPSGLRKPLKPECACFFGTHGCLHGLGPGDCEDIVTWNGALFDIVGSWLPSWDNRAFDVAYMVPH